MRRRTQDLRRCGTPGTREYTACVQKLKSATRARPKPKKRPKPAPFS